MTEVGHGVPLAKACAAALLCLAVAGWCEETQTPRPLPLTLPAGECRLFEDFRGRIYFTVKNGQSGGVFVLDGGALKRLVQGPLDGAAVTFSGDIFMTRDNRILRRGADRDADTDVTDLFGVTGPAGEVVVTEEDLLWVEGCGRFRETDGSFSDVPASGEVGRSVLPMTRDIAGNDWGIDAAGRRLAVSPAQFRQPPTAGRVVVLPHEAKPVWQVEPANHGLPPGDWKFLAADDIGDIWAATDSSLWLLHLRNEFFLWGSQSPTNYWREAKEPVRDEEKKLRGGTITAMARRPLGGGVLAGYSTGRILHVATTDFVDWNAMNSEPGKVSTTVLRDKGDGPVRRLWIDRSGQLWAVTGNSLEKVGAAAWQGWRRLPSLPFGVMGSGTVSSGDRLLVGGSLQGAYGLPVSIHMGAVDVYGAGRGTPWAPVARLRLGRGFTGTTERQGRIWVVSGTSIEWHGCGPTDWVEHFDPRTGELDIGPRTYGWRAHAAAVTWQDRVYVMGVGIRVNAYSGFMESYAPGEKAWRPEDEPPVAFTTVGKDGQVFQPGIYDRIPVSACVIDDVIYVFTSRHGLLSYHPSAQVWRGDLPKAPEQPEEPHVVAVDGEVWLVANDAVHAYVPAKNEWRRVAALPVRKEWGLAGRMGDYLVIGGGYPCGAMNELRCFSSQEMFALPIPKEVRP